MFGNVQTGPLADFIEWTCPGEWGDEDKNGNGIKVIRTANFTNKGVLNLEDVVTRNIDSKKIGRKILKKGDIILERSGGTKDCPVGRVCYFNSDGDYLFNNFTQLLRCKQSVNPIFVFYSLHVFYKMNKTIIRSMGSQTTGIQNLRLERYMQIPIANASRNLQDEFERIYKQADKSGYFN